MRYIKTIFLLHSILAFVGSALCLVVGSEKSVSVQSKPVFPSSDTNNMMKGFAAFANGFTLEDNNTSCTFNARLPVSGSVALNGGTLYLNQDLVFDSGVNLSSVGHIYGNEYAIMFPRKASGLTLPSGTGIGVLSLVDQFDFGSGADVKVVDWSYDDNYVAGGADRQQELRILYFDGNTLTSTVSVDFGSVDALSVRWHPSAYYVAVGRSSGSGDDLEIYHLSVFNGSFSKTDGKNVSESVRALAWHPTGNYLAAGLSSGTNEIRLYSFNNGLITEVSTVNLTPSSNVGKNAISWDRLGNYLAVGVSDEGVVDNLRIYHFDGASLTFTVGESVEHDVKALDYSPTGTYIIIGLGGSSERLRLYKHNISNGTLTEVTGARAGKKKSVYSVHWANDGSKFAVGRRKRGAELNFYGFDKDAEMFVNDYGKELGNSVNAVRFSHDGKWLVTGDENENVSIFSVVVPEKFIFSDALLFFNSDIVFSTTLQLQGNCIINSANKKITFSDGTMLFLKSGANAVFEDTEIVFDRNTTISFEDSSASLKLLRSKLSLPEETTITGGNLDLDKDFLVTTSYWNSAVQWAGNDITVNLTERTSLCRTWTFSGNCVINGKGNTLSLVEGGYINILPNSRLKIINTTIEGVSGDSVKCCDDTGSLLLENVKLVLNNDYNFSKGSLDFREHVEMRGEFVFVYQTAMTSTIHSNAKLVLDTGLTFSYDPGIASQNLLYFEDNTALLWFNGATLHVTATGMQFTRGKMKIKGLVNFETEKQTFNFDEVLDDETITNTFIVDGGIILGNNAEEDDFICEIDSGSELKIRQGTFDYRVTDPVLWIMRDNLATLFMDSDTTLKLYQDLDVESSGRLEFGSNVVLARVQGKGVKGPITLNGKVIYKRLWS